MAENNNDKGGLSIGMILFLIFLILKLGGWGVVATWSWWWVFSPILIPLVLVLFFVLLAVIFNKL